MPWAEQLPSGLWRACWRDELNRKRSRSGYTRRAEALRVAGEREAKNRRGESTPDGRAPTWQQWSETWTAARTIEASTRHNDGILISRYLIPQWGHVRINRITRTQVQAWVNELGRSELSPASVERIYRVLSASMTAALHDETTPVLVNPCAGVKRAPIASGHERFLTRQEADAIIEQLNGVYRLAAVFAFGTGMRWGELAGLHWHRVDLAAGTIDVIETWDHTSQEIKPYPKGRKPRTVPIPPWLGRALDEALDRRRPRDECGVPHARGGPRCRSGLVLEAPKGGALDGRNFGRRQWAEACAAADLKPQPRPHDARHSYASWLVQDGVPLQEVQRLLGHSSIVTTQRYAHLGTSQNERVLAALA